MQRLTVVVCLSLLVVPLVAAQTLDPEIEHLVHDAEQAAATAAALGPRAVDYILSHATCDPADLGQLQSDGYNTTGAARACDAPDALADLDADRLVAVNGDTRGFLFFAAEGVDDDDFLTLRTQTDDREFRYQLAFELGIDNAPDVEFGAIDFDVLTQDGHSLLDDESPAYDVPEGFGEPAFPPAGPGRAYFEVDVDGSYTASATQYKLVATPEAGEAAPHAWLLLEDDSWIELDLDSDTSTAKKYTAPAGSGACGVVKIVVELPAGGAKQAPHIAHAPPRGSCQGSVHEVPAPTKAPMEGSFTVPAWLAGQDLAVRIWVIEYTDEALARQTPTLAAPALDIGDLFAPRTMSCDDQGACIFDDPGESERPDEPAEWSLVLDRLPALAL